MAGAKEPIQLRNVSLQDIANYIVVANSSQMNVILSDEDKKLIRYVPRSSVVITEEMTQGVRPENLTMEWAVDNGITGKVILVHGYCAKSTPWINNLNDWTDVDYVEFLMSSDTNDAFANKIYQFGKGKGYTSYALAGYSQGGMAITHLKTFYWTEADVPKNGLVLQSVSTPYGGSSIAGSTASLGEIFGIGCGENFDLTHDGANLWQNSIPQAQRAAVNFYYVQYGDNGFATRFCNAAINTMMDKPNDGATEVAYATFSGAKNMGLTVGECHVSGMKYPPAFADSARNKQMSAAAARG